MNIAIWIAVALVCFVLPSVALTNGGRKAPGHDALAKLAHNTRLPITDEVIEPLSDRIRRRERGMAIGGIAAIVVAGIASIFVDGSEQWGPLVVPLAGAGTGLGAAWAMATRNPTASPDRPAVARTRLTSLSDYLTKGERIGLIAAPPTVVAGAAIGVVLFLQLPEDNRQPWIGVGLAVTGIALAMWAAARLALRQLLAAPARSNSDLELAWDDAERAIGLRQVSNLILAVSCIALGFWIALMALAVTNDGFYQTRMTLTYQLSLTTLGVFAALIIVVLAGPVRSLLRGETKGYEQRQLWPNGVTAP